VAFARRNWPALEKVEVVDRHTVRFVNRTPDVTMEGRLARYGSDICSRRGFESAASWLDWARRPITTGPYMVAEFRPDVSLTLLAHDQYWGGRPPLRQIRFVEVPEVSSRINGLLSGEYQFACAIPPDQIAGIERNRAFEVQGGTILNHRLTVFDKNHPQLRDARMRRALTHAIDRQAIVDALWAGRTRIPKGLQWEYYGEIFHADWEVPRFDPAEARRLLREANYRGEPIPYRLLNNDYTNQVNNAQIVVESFRAAGLNVQIEMKENFSQVTARTPGAGSGTGPTPPSSAIPSPASCAPSARAPRPAAPASGSRRSSTAPARRSRRRRTSSGGARISAARSNCSNARIRPTSCRTRPPPSPPSARTSPGAPPRAGRWISAPAICAWAPEPWPPRRWSRSRG
jgi:ABC-type transport system substrate-binding protein